MIDTIHKYFGEKKFKWLAFVLLALFLSNKQGKAQSNDHCDNAIVLNDVINYCSAYGEFTNFGASPSIPFDNICIPNESTAKDVWFKFTAVANFISLKVIGAVANSPGGTLISPQAIIYSGSCGNLVELNCISDGHATNQVDQFAGPLTIGQEYYINVSARNDVVGSFQLCINNYNLTFLPESDCPTAQVLCDKSSVYIENVVGAGNLTNEFGSNICIREEYASSWFRWTCSKSGTLTIKLTPLKPEDDLDFALFELPGGINDCEGKSILRCGAAGENVGQPLSNWIQCTGATGLNLTSTDTNEEPGCNGGNDNWVRYIDMEVGKSYALIVNNFSQSGQGFFMEFGGDGEFLGARADFSIMPETTCFEDTLTFIDLSQEPTDPIVQWQWNFGENSNPSSDNSKFPPKVKYDRPGYKTIGLTITSQDGCVHTINKTFIAKCCVDPLNVRLADNANGEIDLGQSVELYAEVTNSQGNVTFEWSPASYLICQNCPSNVGTPYTTTLYKVVAQDDKGCISEDTLEIRVIANYSIFAPNIFTPNHDGINDNFTIFSNIAARNIRVLRVFNRWGACVYEGKDLPLNNDNIGWNGTFRGKPMNPDVFVFYAEVEFLDGHVEIAKGSVTIMK